MNSTRWAFSNSRNSVQSGFRVVVSYDLEHHVDALFWGEAGIEGAIVGLRLLGRSENLHGPVRTIRHLPYRLPAFTGPAVSFAIKAANSSAVAGGLSLPALIRFA